MEEPILVINFPRPPSANRMFTRQITRKGRRNLTPEYKAWRDEAGWIVKMQIVGFTTIESRFDVTIEVPFSRMDTDNHLKPILDLAQNIGIISNDRNANQITIKPVERDDVMVAFWLLPELGAVRKQAPARYVGRAWGKPKPSRKNALVSAWLYNWLCHHDELPKLNKLASACFPDIQLIADAYLLHTVLGNMRNNGLIDWRSGTVSENRGHQAIRIRATGKVLKTAGCPFEPPA